MSTRVRKLKMWNGKVFGGEWSDFNINVAETSQIKAAKLVSEVCGSQLSIHEFRSMYSEVWGNDMNGIVPQDPCVFVTAEGMDAPKRIA